MADWEEFKPTPKVRPYRPEYGPRVVMRWIRRWLAGPWAAFREWVRKANLFSAVAASVVVSVCVAVTAYLVLHRLLPIGADAIQPKDLVQFALTVAAGIGGVVALVVAYRRQQGVELGRFVERFGAAANQLGSADVAVRLAGVYAMAGLADDAAGHERQQCIDVLCGYLRLPYSPDTGSSNARELVHKVPAHGGKESRELHYLYRQNDREVRQTIVRVVAAHLQPNARVSWSACDFDFSQAHLEDVDFRSATFLGQTTFARAEFSGSWTLFSDAVFRGGFISFHRAAFGASRTLFDRATFDGELINFDSATFRSDQASFERTYFLGHRIRFNKATFSGKQTSFDHARFFDGETTFLSAAFGVGGGITTFSGTQFSVAGRRAVSFRGADFGTKEIRLDHALPPDPGPDFDWDDEVSEGERKPKPPNVIVADRPSEPTPVP
jgi:uncharacterized protein YjbI with pentapeptide repeats